MNRPTFSQTVDVLVKAYLNDTLEHGNYCACAVGNLIADAVGAEIVLKHNHRNYASKYEWSHPEYSGDEWFLKINGCENQIKASGYSYSEIWVIEKAFESTRFMEGNDDEIMFMGLMAVVDVLASIHNVDLSTKEQAKLLFVK